MTQPPFDYTATSEQKFKRGDVVRVSDASPVGWGRDAKGKEYAILNSRAGQQGIVIGSYKDQFGGPSAGPVSYTLMFNGNGVSWFDEHDLTLVRHGSESDITAQIAERESRESHERDLSWIAAHWLEIRERVPGATAEELMRRVGINEPWGSQGEGSAWYANWQQTFSALDPILSEMPENPEIAILGIRLSPIDYRIG